MKEDEYSFEYTDESCTLLDISSSAEYHICMDNIDCPVYVIVGNKKFELVVTDGDPELIFVEILT